MKIHYIIHGPEGSGKSAQLSELMAEVKPGEEVLSLPGYLYAYDLINELRLRLTPKVTRVGVEDISLKTLLSRKIMVLLESDAINVRGTVLPMPTFLFTVETSYAGEQLPEELTNSPRFKIIMC